jgi:hypothetical protein
MTKEDILSNLNSVKKLQGQDNGWINSNNNKQMTFLKFFKLGFDSLRLPNSMMIYSYQGLIEATH